MVLEQGMEKQLFDKYSMKGVPCRSSRQMLSRSCLRQEGSVMEYQIAIPIIGSPFDRYVGGIKCTVTNEWWGTAYWWR